MAAGAAGDTSPAGPAHAHVHLGPFDDQGGGGAQLLPDDADAVRAFSEAFPPARQWSRPIAWRLPGIRGRCNDRDVSFDELPQRIYLDTNVIGALWDHGGPIFEGEPLKLSGRSGAGEADIEALRLIFLINERALLEWVISTANLDEVAQARDGRFLRWALDILDHWDACIDGYRDSPAFTGHGAARLGRIDGCGYLSRKDRLIVADAVRLECDALLTLEGTHGCLGASRNREHMQRVLGLTVLGPQGLWRKLRPWAGLFA